MSTLTNPHIIAGDFNASLYSFLKQREEFVPRIYLDGKNVPTLGKKKVSGGRKRCQGEEKGVRNHCLN